MKNKKLKLLFGLIVVLALSVVFASVAFAADDDEPQLLTKSSKTTKGVTTITLNVTGDADVTESKLVKANVLVVFDTSNSMTDNRASGTTGPYRADAGEYAISQFAHKLFTMAAEGGEGSSVQMALITFNSEASTVQNWTSTETDITGKLSADGTENSRKLNNVNGTNYYARGTNWEAAMVAARTAVAAADSDPTFVLFFTDGTPSKHLNDSGAVTPAGMTFYNDPEDRVMCAQESMPAARNVDTYDTAHDDYLPHPTGADASVYSDNTTLYGIYAWGDTSVAGDYLDDVIYYAMNGSERTLASGQTAEDTITDGISDQYYPANNTDALTTAINKIFDSIASAAGISEAAISDGTTSKVTTTSGAVNSLLKVDEDSYKYYLEIPLTSETDPETEATSTVYVDNDNVKWIITFNSDKTEVTLTNAADSSKKATYEVESSSDESVKVKWPDSAGTDFYAKAPKAKLNDGAVDWDLSAEEYCPLLNGVTYYYSFDCVPSQETNDLIAKLKNKEIEYTDTDDDPSNDLDANIKKYIVKNGDDYALKTNTEATMTYIDTREENPQEHTTPPVENPEPIPAEAQEIDLQKIWIGSYWNPKLNNGQGGLEEEQDVTLKLVCDEEDTASSTTKNDTQVTLKASDEFEKSTFISIGSMSVDKTTGVGKVYVAGHDYQLKETGEVSFHWELIADVMHPMAVNGTVTMLVEAEKAPASWPTGDGVIYAKIDNVEYYKIGSTYYTPSATDTNAITAKNYRRADLNLTKAVEGNNAPEGSQFTFTMKLELPTNAPTGEKFWFSVWNGQYVDLTKISGGLSGAVKAIAGEGGNDPDGTPLEGDPDGWTGYYIAENNTTITVKLEAGWNLRFTNVLTGTKYTFTETAVPDHFLCNAIKLEYDTIDDEALEVPDEYQPTITPADKKIEGSVVVAANSYTVTYTNEYDLTQVDVEKVWSDSDNAFATRPENGITVQLYADGEAVSGKTLTLTADATDATKNWKGSFTDLDKYKQVTGEDGTVTKQEIVYTVDEASTPSGYTKTVSGGTITNTLQTGDLKITKTVTGGDNSISKYYVTVKNADGDYIALANGKPSLVSAASLEDEAPPQIEVAANNSVTITGLPVGEYTVEEVTSTTGENDTTVDLVNIPGYTLKTTYDPAAKKANVAAPDPEAASNEPAEVKITNEYTKNTGEDREDTEVTVRKVAKNEKDETVIISGATFTLKSGDNQIWEKQGGEFTISTSDSALADYLPTTDGGKTTLTLSESDPPLGYEGAEGSYTVTITTTIEEKLDETQDKFITTTTYDLTISGTKEETTGEGEEAVTKTVLEVVNTKKTATEEKAFPIISKVDENDEPLAGAEFTLYDAEGNAVATATSDEDGMVVFTSDTFTGDIPADGTKLTLKESNPPSGYALNEDFEEEVTFKVDVSEDYDSETDKYVTTTTYFFDGQEQPFTVKNEPAGGEGTLKIVKTFDGPADLPETTKFKITGPDYNETVSIGEDFTKTGEGEYTYEVEVPAGEYTVTENKSSAMVDGYTLHILGDNGVPRQVTEKGFTFYIRNRYADPSSQYVPEELNGEDHYAYMIGYPDGLVHPERNITRAEVATIFFRLLTDEAREANLTTVNTFGDVNDGQWFNVSVSTMANMGIVNGYPDGDFHPNDNITRAEFAAIAARFDKEAKDSANIFTDIDGHWAKSYILRAVNRGWINGYPDSTFRPDRLATRAEVAAMVNRVLVRDPEDPDDLLPDMIKWPDNMDTNAWYYLDIQEATNTHEYERVTKPTEVWIQMLENPDWTKYQY